LNLSLDKSIAEGYKSHSQQARVITESWIEDEMYCPSCNQDHLERLRHGTRVVDFLCEECREPFQVKSMSHKMGSRIVDSAYEAMVNAIELGNCPSLIILHYSREDWTVENIILIPRHLLGPSAIEKRNPLADSARRAGWIGCNIILDNVPSSGRIYAVRDREAVEPNHVRREWSKYSFTKLIEPTRRGWLIDVLTCIQSLGKARFTLSEVYGFEHRLSNLHPENRHVRPKIRQQLQVLRDMGMLRFVAPGVYEISD
jgi:type II restriction enzyme